MNTNIKTESKDLPNLVLTKNELSDFLFISTFWGTFILHKNIVNILQLGVVVGRERRYLYDTFCGLTSLSDGQSSSVIKSQPMNFSVFLKYDVGLYENTVQHFRLEDT